MSRFMKVLGFVVLSLSSVACYIQPETGDLGGSRSGAAGSTSSTNEGAATCDAVCGHYLECKGIDNAQNRAACTKNCEGMNLSAADRASFVQTDCATAITMVEGGGQKGTSSAKGSECDGCVRDGNECIWLSQSDWGPGPYGGAASSCKAYCCE